MALLSDEKDSGRKSPHTLWCLKKQDSESNQVRILSTFNEAYQVNSVLNNKLQSFREGKNPPTKIMWLDKSVSP